MGFAANDHDAEIEFTDPPRPRNGRSQPSRYTLRWAEECRQHPGQWAVFGRYNSQPRAVDTRQKIIDAGGPAFGDATWEATTRKTDTREWTVYGRFISEEPPGT